MSWFRPPPPDGPIRLPRRTSKTVIPSYIGSNGGVLHLLMHRGARDIIRDYSPNNSDFSRVSPAWTDGGWGWALDFNGTTDELQRAATPSLNNIPLMTIALWIYIRTAKQQYLAASQTGTGFNRNWVIDIQPTGTVSWRWADGAAASFALITAGVIPLNAWNCIIATRDGATARVDINGIVESLVYAVAPTANANPISYGLGSGDVTVARHFDGLMAFSHIWNRYLVPSERTSYYESTRRIFGV